MVCSLILKSLLVSGGVLNLDHFITIKIHSKNSKDVFVSLETVLHLYDELIPLTLLLHRIFTLQYFNLAKIKNSSISE